MENGKTVNNFPGGESSASTGFGDECEMRFSREISLLLW